MAHVTTDLRIIVYEDEDLAYLTERLRELEAFPSVVRVDFETDVDILKAADVVVVRVTCPLGMLIVETAKAAGKLLALVADNPSDWLRCLGAPFDAVDNIDGICTWLSTTAPFMVQKKDALPPEVEEPKTREPDPPMPDKPDPISEAVHGHVSRLNYMASIVEENADTISQLEHDEDKTAPGMNEMFGHLRQEVKAIGVQVEKHKKEINRASNS